ncbi:glycosyltransferase [Aliifodinibius salicampi]|uniref:Glycosyltransferase n=1 Tax=Fodinibius salicampi TaxID=1920655 RepID=A0ABT3PV60_9BACT|nr:glycosyltransferase family 2 protein [Fodinibius salicampi]MCW9711740.1 glycosyltransferase [Fodinibius salicampi]
MSKDNLPLVTIGIPTYNRADAYLKEALESALNQTYSNIEIVVSDNCSTDNTSELVNCYQDSRIKYYRHNENIGANNNFNYCLEKASGEYFLLLHDDDKVDSDFVEACLEDVNYRTDVGLIRTGVRVIDEFGNELQFRKNFVDADTIEKFIEQWMDQRKVSIYLCSVLYNRKGLQQIGGFTSPQNLLQDNVAEIKLTAMMGRADVSQVKASFRRHGDNKGGSESVQEWAMDSNHILHLIKEHVSDQDLIKKSTINLCEWNYNRVYRIKSPLVRWRSYLINYKMFDYYYSPFSYVYKRDIRPKLRKIRSLFFNTETI